MTYTHNSPLEIISSYRWYTIQHSIRAVEHVVPQLAPSKLLFNLLVSHSYKPRPGTFKGNRPKYIYRPWYIISRVNLGRSRCAFLSLTHRFLSCRTLQVVVYIRTLELLLNIPFHSYRLLSFMAVLWSSLKLKLARAVNLSVYGSTPYGVRLNFPWRSSSWWCVCDWPYSKYTIVIKTSGTMLTSAFALFRSLCGVMAAGSLWKDRSNSITRSNTNRTLRWCGGCVEVYISKGLEIAHRLLDYTRCVHTLAAASLIKAKTFVFFERKFFSITRDAWRFPTTSRTERPRALNGFAVSGKPVTQNPDYLSFSRSHIKSH